MGAMTTPRMALMTTAASLAYLGLAVLGGGGFAAFFSHPPLIALTIVLFALSGAALFTRGNLSSGEREDRGNRWVLIAFGVLGLLAGYLPAYTDRKEFWTIDGDTIRWLGVLLFAARRSSAALAGLCSRPSVQRAGRVQPGHCWSSATPAIWGCSSTRWAGDWHFDRRSASSSPPSCFRPSSPASAPKRECCALSSAANTTPTAAAPRASCQGFTEPSRRRGFRHGPGATCPHSG